jgi:hypothetical protein
MPRGTPLDGLHWTVKSPSNPISNSLTNSSLSLEYGPFWMFMVEKSEKDSELAAKLRDIFRSDFERFIAYYYRDIEECDKQFFCCHLRRMFNQYENTMEDAFPRHCLHYPKTANCHDTFYAVLDIKIINTFMKNAKDIAVDYLDTLRNFWLRFDDKKLDKLKYPKMPWAVP